MRNGSPTLQGITRRALEEHRQIRFYLDQITQTLLTITPDMTDIEPMRRLAAQLEGLKERLVEHRQTGEPGGLYQRILEVLPARRVEIDRLSNQHGRIVEILEMARIHAQCDEVSAATSLKTDLEHFLTMFRQHERDEEQLLLQVREREQPAID